MTPQEHSSLEYFLKQLAEAPAAVKDAQADAMIQSAVAKRPDAAYLLVQRAMLLEQALEQSKAQISQLQSQAGGAGFMPRQNPWLAGVPAGMPPMPAQQQAPLAGGGVSSFLGNVATTAAGVVAGSFLFQGLEHMLHSPHAGGWMADNGTDERDAPVETTVINNYYGDVQPATPPEPPEGDMADYVNDSADQDEDSTWI